MRNKTTQIPEEVSLLVKEYRRAEKEIEKNLHIPFVGSEVFVHIFIPKLTKLIKKYGMSTLKKAFREYKKHDCKEVVVS